MLTRIILVDLISTISYVSIADVIKDITLW